MEPEEEAKVLKLKEIQSFQILKIRKILLQKKDLQKGIEFSGGSLGLGLSYAVGVAYACRKKGLKNRVFVIVGDGELNEGITWEALMFAAHNHLNNLTIIVDHNHLQADGFIEDVMNTSPLEEKCISFGFDTDVVDGHSVPDLFEAFAKKTEDSPRAIIAETIKGKGVSFIENKVKWHHGSLNEQRYLKALKELEEEVGDDR